MNYPIIDFEKLNNTTNRFLYDMEICRKKVFHLQPIVSQCWNCGDCLDGIEPISIPDTTPIGCFCCVSCVYSDISYRQREYRSPINNILNRLKVIHGVDHFTHVPPREYVCIDDSYKEIINAIKHDGNKGNYYNTSLSYLNNTVIFTATKI